MDAALNEDCALCTIHSVIRAVKARFGGAAGDIAGVEEGIDVIESPVVRKDVLKDGRGRRCG